MIEKKEQNELKGMDYFLYWSSLKLNVKDKLV